MKTKPTWGYSYNLKHSAGGALHRNLMNLEFRYQYRMGHQKTASSGWLLAES